MLLTKILFPRIPRHLRLIIFFFFNDTATTEIYTLSLHDALPICPCHRRRARVGESGRRPQSNLVEDLPHPPETKEPDRKSTRLNSSHSQISYAVFCLKKKKNTNTTTSRTTITVLNTKINH